MWPCAVDGTLQPAADHDALARQLEHNSEVRLVSWLRTRRQLFSAIELSGQPGAQREQTRPDTGLTPRAMRGTERVGMLHWRRLWKISVFVWCEESGVVDSLQRFLSPWQQPLSTSDAVCCDCLCFTVSWSMFLVCVLFLATRAMLVFLLLLLLFLSVSLFFFLGWDFCFLFLSRFCDYVLGFYWLYMAAKSFTSF